MKIYLDLEANAITQEIISIGAIAENGKKFYSLVKPHSKLDHKIKELTGISEEDVVNAKSIDEVMFDFNLWRISECDADIPHFLVFGSGDYGFISSTMNFTNDTDTLKELFYIKVNLEDVSNRIAKKFNRNSISLRSAYLTMQLSCVSEINDIHNALNDAAMLKWVFENIDDYELPNDVEVVKVPKPNMKYKVTIKNDDPRLSRRIKITRPPEGDKPERVLIVKNANEAYRTLGKIEGSKKKNIISKIILACESGAKYRRRYFSFED